MVTVARQLRNEGVSFPHPSLNGIPFTQFQGFLQVMISVFVNVT